MKTTISIVFFLMACSEKSNSDIDKEVYKNIHKSPVLSLFSEVSAFIRGDAYYIFIDSTNMVLIETNGKIYRTNHKLSISDEKRIRTLLQFMVKNGIKKMDAYHVKSRELEFRINEKLVLIKNPSQEYKNSSLKSDFHTPLQKLGDDWYFYEDKKDYDFGG